MLLVERPADEGDDGAGEVADREGQAAPQDALGGHAALPAGTDLLGEPEGLEARVVGLEPLGVGLSVKFGEVGSSLRLLWNGGSPRVRSGILGEELRSVAGANSFDVGNQADAIAAGLGPEAIEDLLLGREDERPVVAVAGGTGAPQLMPRGFELQAEQVSRALDGDVFLDGLKVNVLG